MPYSLQHISVEGLFAVAEELSDHLAAQALPLQQKVGDADGRVWDEAPRDQELKALVRVSEANKPERKKQETLVLVRVTLTDSFGSPQPP